MTKFNYKEGKVFLRDKFVPFSDATVSIASAPVLYGLSVYSVFNVMYNDKTNEIHIFRLRDHYKRLVNSARIMDFHSFEKEWPYQKFERTIRDLLSENKIEESVLVRASIFIDEIMSGTKIHDLKQSFSAFIYPFGQLLPSTGANICVSSWTRNVDNTIPSRAKVNGSYVNASLMKNEAMLNGYDDAIALDSHGHVAEGTVANFFMVRNGELITPDPSTDILEGITRDTIIEIAKDLSIPLQIRSIDRSELYLAEEAFLCGSSANIAPVISIDRRPIGDSKTGPITQKLSAKYNQIRLGGDETYNSWLTTL